MIVKSEVVEKTIRTAQHIIHKMPLDNQRSGQTVLFNVRGIPKEVHCEPISDLNMISEWVIPEVHDDRKMIFYIHGGGYGMGDLASSRALISPIACYCGLKAISFEYRLAPEYHFPAPIEDCAEAYLYVLSLGYEPKNIVMLGDSAGGGLMFAFMQYMKQHRYPMPCCGVALSPWTDLTITSETYNEMDRADPLLSANVLEKFADDYIDDDSPLDPLISPVFGSYDKTYPPILIQVGDKEVLYGDSVRMNEVLQKGGVDCKLEVYPDMFHIFQLWRIREAEIAIDFIDDFIQSKFSLKDGEEKRETGEKLVQA